MAKKAVVTDKVKIRGIRRRWLIPQPVLDQRTERGAEV